MGCVQQAVLDFDEEVQAPWRPRLVAVPGGGALSSTGPLRPRPSGRSSSRVGICRPPEPAVEPAHPTAPMPSRPGMPAAPARRGLAVRVVASPALRRPGGPAAARARLRLTWRARLLAAVLTLSLGVAIGSWLGPVLAGADGDLRLAGVESVVVQPGDTLWSIAAAAAGTADVRVVVDKIQELNGLRGTVLVPGQVLELP